MGNREEPALSWSRGGKGGGLRGGLGGDSAPRKVHQVRVDELKRCMMPGVLWAVLGSTLHLGDD